MSPRRPKSSQLRGFTLIEILIIAALIALLSGIAVFQVKAVMDQTRVKATYADLRGVADSLSTAQMDLGMFPKLGFLSLSQPQLVQNNNTLPEDFDVMGFATTGGILPQRIGQIVENWNGPYFNAAGGRSPLKTGTRGYYVQMRLPRAAANAPLSPWPIGPLLDWPADPWGNPYVVYLIHLDKGVQDPKDPNKFLSQTATPRFVRSPYEEANYFAAVVSYGPNGIPGGSADPHFGYTPSVVAAGKPYQLFTVDPLNPSGFLALTDAQLPRTNDGLTTRILSLSVNAPFGYAISVPADTPPVPGILDPGFVFTKSDGTKVNVMGSDDIVVPIR